MSKKISYTCLTEPNWQVNFVEKLMAYSTTTH